MVQQTYIKADLSELQKIVKDMGHNFYTRVGIIGANASKHHKVAETKTLKSGKKKRVKTKEVGDMTMSEIGIIQEFGSMANNIPPRSFLRMPLEEKKRDIIRFLSSPPIRAMISKGEIKRAFDALGAEALGIILDAFATRGFGHWADNSQRTIDKKLSDSPLIDIGELRKSITWDVKQK